MTTAKDARIYVDGEAVGVGTAEVRQRGLPVDADVVVETPDGRRARATLERHFTLTTFAIGIVTYGVGFIVGWEYPDSLFVPLEERRDDTGSDWGSAGDDVWMRPPAGWRPPAEAPAEPPDDAPAEAPAEPPAEATPPAEQPPAEPSPGATTPAPPPAPTTR
jgi:hypothetical protein